MNMELNAQMPSTAIPLRKDIPCLVFSLLGKLYGVEARHVKEMFRLPEITPLDDAPAYVVGVINLRGCVVPVVDINLRMRCVAETYKISDAVVVLQQESNLVGMIISEVQEVRVLHDGDIDDSPDFTDPESRKREPFMTGVAKLDDEIVMLIDPNRLLSNQTFIPQSCPSTSESFGTASEEIEKQTESEESFRERRVFLPTATLEDRTILQERAKRLRQRSKESDATALTSMAVVEIHGEFLGIELNVVSGFSQVQSITPIPCCPDHIAGSMNLRGEILTLLNIGRILDISPNMDKPSNKVVVAQVRDLRIGILVNEIVDILHLHPNEILQPPVATGALKKEFLKGSATYGTRMLSILNMETTLSRKELIVDEKV